MGRAKGYRRDGVGQGEVEGEDVGVRGGGEG